MIKYKGFSYISKDGVIMTFDVRKRILYLHTNKINSEDFMTFLNGFIKANNYKIRDIITLERKK